MANQVRRRAIKYGSNALTSILIVLGLITGINLLGIFYQVRFDTTEGGIYSLSDQTLTLLSGLESDVSVISFFREQERKAVEPLLRQYAYHSDRFSYRVIDPDREPVEARRFKINSYGMSVVISGDREERIATTEEKDLTNAIAKAVQQEKKVIYFLTGHGESSVGSTGRTGYSRIRNLLLEANYDVRDSLVLVTEKVPEDCDLLVVPGPKTRLYPTEVNAIRSHFEGGQFAGIFLMDPGYRTGLEPMLESWSVVLNGDLVIEQSAVGKTLGMDYSMPAVATYAVHPVTEKHEGLMTVFQFAQSLGRRGTVPNMKHTKLAMTTSSSWGETDLSILGKPGKPEYDPATDTTGPLTLAVALEGELNTRLREKTDHSNRNARIVIFGDSDFANNQLLSMQGNADLFLNAVSWALDEGARISIRPKERGYRPITLSVDEGQWIKLLSLVFIPGIPVILGLLVWYRRR
ncbi:TPA: hypothetical protein DCE37_03040 [Candidatus Latescibacteria bacterium]|nr:hypothetical protein [Candidatus Latescibacterota bacterium]